jgi:hypothetical protein
MDPTVTNALGPGAAILVFLLGLGIFARKEDIEKLRAESYLNFVMKMEMNDRMSELRDELRNLNVKIDKLAEK